MSISLVDIAIQCLSKSSCTHTQRYVMLPSETVKFGSRSVDLTYHWCVSAVLVVDQWSSWQAVEGTLYMKECMAVIYCWGWLTPLSTEYLLMLTWRQLLLSSKVIRIMWSSSSIAVIISCVAEDVDHNLSDHQVSVCVCVVYHISRNIDNDFNWRSRRLPN